MHHTNMWQKQGIGWRLKLGAKWAIVHWTGHLNGKQNSILNKKVANSLVSMLMWSKQYNYLSWLLAPKIQDTFVKA